LFDDEIRDLHWSNAVTRNPLIAIANRTSHISLIDPR
uniref:DUF58 domain-containing protein n=1 Tax=Gongylonema pulchrum TaxID=637853 RepID=A0A183D433_9BILA